MFTNTMEVEGGRRGERKGERERERDKEGEREGVYLTEVVYILRR